MKMALWQDKSGCNSSVLSQCEYLLMNSNFCVLQNQSLLPISSVVRFTLRVLTLPGRLVQNYEDGGYGRGLVF